MHVGTQHSPTVCMWVSVIYVRQCYILCVYAIVVFKNGKCSFTQCILVHMHKGV